MLPDTFIIHEKNLREKIMHGEAPFISLYEHEMHPNIRKMLHGIFQQEHTPDDIKNSFEHFPALTLSYFTSAISNSETDTLQIWLPIENAFGLSALSTNQREMIWQSFRNACIQLELSVSLRTSGQLYMVKEFLHHTGVQKRFAPTLSNAMIRLGENVGSPNTDDPESLATWTKELLRKYLNPPFSKLTREAIELDDQYYYTQVFWELKTEQRQAQNPLEEEFANSSKTHSFSLSMSIPKIILLENVIYLQIPQSLDITSINIDDQLFEHFDTKIDGIFSLQSEMSMLPKRVHVTSKGNQWKYELWEDDKSNRVLLFGGRNKTFISQLKFNEEYPLAPGDYDILCRFEPSDNEDFLVQHIHDSPTLYHVTFTITPGKQLEFSLGPARIIFVGDSVPLMRFAGGESYVDAQGTLVWSDENLCLDISIPQELRNEKLCIDIKSKCLGCNVIEIEPPYSNNFRYPLSNIFSTFKTGFDLVTVVCRKQDRLRSLARMAGLVWNGLRNKNDKGELCCTNYPSNFDKILSNNVTVCEDDGFWKLGIREIFNRQWITTFTNGRKLFWVRPGVYTVLRTYQDGSFADRPLKEGEELVINNDDNMFKELRIWGLSDGELRLGSRRWLTSSKSSFWSVRMSSLVDESSQGGELYYYSELTDEERTLLVLVHQNFVKDYAVNYTNEFAEIRCSFHDKQFEYVQIIIENINTNEIQSHEVLLDATGESRQIDFKGCITNIEKYDDSFIITNYAANWSDGIYFVTAKFLDNGIWGRMTNKRGDVYEACFAVINSEIVHPIKYLEGMSTFTEYNQILHALYPKILTCFDKKCWFGLLEWIVWWWKDNILKLFTIACESKVQLLDFIKLLEYAPSKENTSSWVPLYSLYIMCPNILSLDSVFYKNIFEKNHFLGCLHHLARLENPKKSWGEQDTDFFVAVAFEDKHQFKRFHLTRLLDGWEHTPEDDNYRHLSRQWIPGRGDFLGRSQYLYGLRRLRHRIEEVEQPGLNEERRKDSLLLCQRPAVWNVLSSYAAIDIWKKFFLYKTNISEYEEDEWCGRLAMIATYAFLCRKSAQTDEKISDTIENFLKSIPHEDMSLGDRKKALNYVVSIGEDIFGFFLLLAEIVLRAK